MIRLYKNISTDPVDLLPADNPNVKTLLKVRDKLERGTQMALVLESEDPAKTLAAMKELIARLEKEPYVGSILYRQAGYDFFDRHKLLFLDLEDLKTIRDRTRQRIQREKLQELWIDLEEEGEFTFKEIEEKYKSRYSDITQKEYFSSPDEKLFSFYLFSKDPDAGLKSASRFYDQIKGFLQREKIQDREPTLKIYLASPSRVLEYRSLIRDLKIAGGISAICIFLPLLFRFKNPLLVALVFVPLLLGIPISFAVGSLFVDKLSVTTSFLFAILGGLGIESGIHIFTHFLASRRRGVPLADSLQEIYSHLGRAILTSVASVAVTFLLLVLNDFRGFSEFGWIAGIGLWIIFALYFLFFPPLLILMEKIKVLRYKALHFKERSFTLPYTLSRVVIVILGLFSLYALASPFFIDFEYDTKKIRADIPEVREAKEKQHATLYRVNKPAVLVIQDHQESEFLKKALEERRLNAQQFLTIDTIRSYFDLVPTDQKEKMDLIAQMQTMLGDPTLRLAEGETKEDIKRFQNILRQTKPFTLEEIPEEFLNTFAGKENVPGHLFYIYPPPRMELDHARHAIQFFKDAGTINTPVGTYYPASDNIIFGAVLQRMFADLPRVLLLSLLSVFAFVYFDFRSLKETGLVFFCILMGVFWLFGVMHILGLKFNLYNLIIIPAVMGMSIDNAIHVMHRYKELGRGSLYRVLSTTGSACLLASLTNAGGFAGFLFTAHQGLFSIGLLAILGIATCLVSTLVFLPFLLKVSERSSF